MSDAGEERADEAARLEALRRNLAEMTAGMEGMLAASIRMQILMLEEAKRMAAAMGAPIDSDASDPDKEADR